MRPIVLMVMLVLLSTPKATYIEERGGRESAYDITSVISRTIVVDQKGHGDATTVQQAIDYVPLHNPNWVHIIVKPGVYVENVKVPKYKPYVYISGEGSSQTMIHSNGTSPTLLVEFGNFVASGIWFKNMYGPEGPAPAAEIYGDKVAFYRCRFSGFQDTLADLAGRHYYKDCCIDGSIDFIWGSAQSVFESCTMNATAGTITAHGRDSPQETSGFVFLSGSVVGTGPTILGRAWRRCSRVLFKGTYLSNTIDPEGWSSWSYEGQEQCIAYSEVDCEGPGADKSRRVKWEKDLGPEELASLANINIFINKDGWIQSQPTSSSSIL